MEFRSLTASEVECRVSTCNEKGASLLLYKDARCDMRILDEAVGAENWQRNHELINGNLFCNVGIKCNGEWVWKQDVGTESYTEKEKGQASDAFKRACFNWGIGRELYTAPFIWVSGCTKEVYGRFTTYDRFEVADMTVDEGVITSLQIINSNSKEVVFTFGKQDKVTTKKKKEEPREESDPKKTIISQEYAKKIRETLEQKGINEVTLFSLYHVNDISELTVYKANNVMDNLDNMKKWQESPDGN